MGLAVPTAVLVATGRGSALGVLVKGGDALQRAAGLRTVVLDKTGTLTAGRPAVVDEFVSGDRAELLAVAAALERMSEHPLARAIVAHANTAAADERGRLPQRGGPWRLSGRRWQAGIRRHAGVARHARRRRSRSRRTGILPHGPRPRAQPSSASPRRRPGEPCRNCSARLRSPTRCASHSAEAVAALKALGVRVVMVSGDRAAAAQAIASRAGIDDVVAGVLPAGKVDEVRRLRAGGPVGMAGDGVNDAPALAAADVGFAMGGGTDVAIHAADVTLMRPDLRLVGVTLRLARAALAVMKQNLFWAFAYNVIAIPIAAGVLYPSFGILLSPTVASAAMALSSVSVVTNSLRLRRVDVGL